MDELPTTQEPKKQQPLNIGEVYRRVKVGEFIPNESIVPATLYFKGLSDQLGQLGPEFHFPSHELMRVATLLRAQAVNRGLSVTPPNPALKKKNRRSNINH